MFDYDSLLRDTSDLNPLKISYLAKSDYFKEFVALFSVLSREILQKDIENILINKLQLSKPTFDLDAYYQSATELSVIIKMISIPHDKIMYEKPVSLGTMKNPECTVFIDPFIINVEAKCPQIPLPGSSENTDKHILVMKSAGRVPGFFEQFKDLKETIEQNSSEVEMIVGKNKDNTMKSFLQSAHDKFPDYRNENELNVLVVALDDVHHMQEWWHYLFENEGLFTKKPFENPKTYSRVDVVIYTNCLFRHKHYNEINGSAWSLDHSFNLFLSNGHRQGAKEKAHVYLASKIRNYTNEIKEHVVEGSAPQYILETLKIASFVKKELEEKRNEYLFTKKMDITT